MPRNRSNLVIGVDRHFIVYKHPTPELLKKILDRILYDGWSPESASDQYGVCPSMVESFIKRGTFFTKGEKPRGRWTGKDFVYDVRCLREAIRDRKLYGY